MGGPEACTGTVTSASRHHNQRKAANKHANTSHRADEGKAHERCSPVASPCRQRQYGTHLLC